MPGKKGAKLIPRKSKSGKFFSVKALVFSLLEKNPDISREEVEKVVAKEYPGSNFIGKDGKGGHFPWYKHQFTRKNLEKDFQLKERGDNESKKDKQPKEETPVSPDPKAECANDSDNTSTAAPSGKGRARVRANRSRVVRS